MYDALITLLPAVHIILMPILLCIMYESIYDNVLITIEDVMQYFNERCTVNSLYEQPRMCLSTHPLTH